MCCNTLHITSVLCSSTLHALGPGLEGGLPSSYLLSRALTITGSRENMNCSSSFQVWCWTRRSNINSFQSLLTLVALNGPPQVRFLLTEWSSARFITGLKRWSWPLPNHQVCRPRKVLLIYVPLNTIGQNEYKNDSKSDQLRPHWV